MQTIAPGVTQVATSKTSNAFVVDGGTGLFLVDTGTAKGLPVLLSAIEELGRRPDDIAGIVLTHAHPDHVQAVPALREHSDARVFVHAADAPWLNGGRVPAEGRSGFSARRFDGLSTAHWKPFTADSTVEDGDLIEGSGLRVVHTPGHSPGHIVLVHEPTRTALVGDAVFHTGKLSLGPSAFASDPGARGAGAARIPHDVEGVGFGHGDPVSGPGVDGFRAFLKSLS